MKVKIIGTGSAVPENVVTNDDLAKIVDTSDEWISSRTGIKKRRIVNDDTVSSMGAKAALSAVKQAGISVEEIDMIIVATMSPENHMPSASCQVQSLIGANNASCFDLNAACTGFVYAFNTASAYISCGLYKTILVIGSEVLSKMTDWTDRTTCVLFGDGAGAVILQSSETDNVLGMVTGSDGVKGDVLTCANRVNNNPFLAESKEVNMDYMKMDGQEVFKFAVRKVPESITKLVQDSNLKIEDIDYFILHQANERILLSVAKKLKVDKDKFFINLNEYGNTSSASIPIALDELARSGKLKKGNKIIISGFGGGLTWGSTLIQY